MPYGSDSVKSVLCISNHGRMLGGGEHSFLDLLLHLPPEWHPLAVLPEEGDLAVRLRVRGVETLVLPLPRIRPWLIQKVLYALKEYLTLSRRYHPSLVYANGSRAAFYGGIASQLRGIPLVWHCRIADRDPALDWLLAALSKRIVVNSKATGRRFGSLFRYKTRVVYNGVDLEWLQSGAVRKPDLIGDGWTVVLAVARASREKRHDILISAFENIAFHDSTLHLVLIGGKDHLDPAWWSYLQSRASVSPCSSRIHWVGYVEDVRPWYRSAHLLALASETESFGRVLVEAMACALPVVATCVGGIPEIIRDGKDGLLVSPGSVTDMTSVFARLLQDEPLRRRLRESGLERARTFNLEAHMERMTSVFEKCLKVATEGETARANPV